MLQTGPDDLLQASPGIMAAMRLRVVRSRWWELPGRLFSGNLARL